jgi:hypothetical protein
VNGYNSGDGMKSGTRIMFTAVFQLRVPARASSSSGARSGAAVAKFKN